MFANNPGAAFLDRIVSWVPARDQSAASLSFPGSLGAHLRGIVAPTVRCDERAGRFILRCGVDVVWAAGGSGGIPQCMAVVGVPASRVAEQASSPTAAPTVPLPSIADATAVLDLSIMNSTGPVKQRERSSALTWDIPAVYGVTELAPGLQGDAAKAFQKPASLHLAAIVQQLLRVGGIDADAAIVGIIVGLAESAAASLSPSALTAAGDINPCHYLKVRLTLCAMETRH